MDDVVALIPVTRTWLKLSLSKFKTEFDELYATMQKIVIGRYHKTTEKDGWFSKKEVKNFYDENNWNTFNGLGFNYDSWDCFYVSLYDTMTNEKVIDGNTYSKMVDKLNNLKSITELNEKLLESASLGNDTINITYNTYCKLT